MFDLIKYPLLTPKAVQLLEFNKYSFVVDNRLTKPELKILFEEIFKVKIISINTLISPNKTKFRNQYKGFSATQKKVIIRLIKKDFISFFPSL